MIISRPNPLNSIVTLNTLLPGDLFEYKEIPYICGQKEGSYIRCWDTQNNTQEFLFWTVLVVPLIQKEPLKVEYKV